MSRSLLGVLSVLLATLVVLALLVSNRHFLLMHAVALSGPPDSLERPGSGDEDPDARWVDDWFTVEEIAPQTWAIGEPRYWGVNYHYLIEGSEWAALFDAGPGVRDLRPVVQSLTSRPILFIPSHFHYDHVGNQVRFEHVAVIDLPGLRERAPDGRLEFEWYEHLGVGEGIEAVPLDVDRWLQPGEAIDLGGRSLEVIYTPGHTPESISLLERARGLLFTGDFLYPGELYAFVPNSSLGDYRRAAATVLASVPDDVFLFPGHRSDAARTKRLAMDDVRDLVETLRALSAGELEGAGTYPVSYPVNDRLDLLAEPTWLARWRETHPDFGERPR